MRAFDAQQRIPWELLIMCLPPSILTQGHGLSKSSTPDSSDVIIKRTSQYGVGGIILLDDLRDTSSTLRCL